MNLTVKNIFSYKLKSDEIDKKIKQLLPSSDYEWATELKNEIMNHPNTIEIRKVMKNMTLDEIRKYQDVILKKSYGPLDEFDEFINKLVQLVRKAQSSACDTINLGPYSIENQKDIDYLENSFNIYYFLMLHDDLPLTKLAQKKYEMMALKILGESICDDDMKTIYMQEKNSIDKYLTEYFWKSYNSFLVRKNYFYQKEPRSYRYEYEARVYKRQYHGYYGSKK